jgi:hypothetical protein
MLFADANDTATGASLIACAFAAINGLFLWLSSRDKLRNDAEVVKLKADFEHLREHTEECQQERVELRAEVADLRRLVIGRADSD